MTTYSEPTRSLTIEDWPSGRHTTEARFTIESNKRGTEERVCRVTDNPRTGRAGKPKKTTYAETWAILRGDDGRTYLAGWNPGHGMISIMTGTMKYSHETIFKGSEPERYNEVAALIEAA